MHFKIRALLLFVLPSFLLCTMTRLSGQQPIPADSLVVERLYKAITFEGKLWLLGRNEWKTGGLITLNLANDETRVYATKDVIDIAKNEKTVCILKKDLENRTLVACMNNGSFHELTSFNVDKDDEPIALLSSPKATVVVCRQSIRSLPTAGESWLLTRIHGRLSGSGLISTVSTADGGSVYVGYNQGEWGGGLQKVDIHSGELSSVQSGYAPKTCCDPVTGLIPDWRHRTCMFASTGLSHVFENGRILGVCDKNVRVVWKKSYSVDYGPQFGGRKEMTEAVFGLSSADDGTFWGITSSGLYHFSRDGTLLKKFALPKLRSVSGIYLSNEIPGVIVVRTDATAEGYTVLVVPGDH